MNLFLRKVLCELTNLKKRFSNSFFRTELFYKLRDLGKVSKKAFPKLSIRQISFRPQN